MEAFLRSIHKRSPDCHVHVIMTDDGIYCIIYALLMLHIHVHVLPTDNTGWSAAREVFGSDLKHILCRWHVDRYVTHTRVPIPIVQGFLSLPIAYWKKKS